MHNIMTWSQTCQEQNIICVTCTQQSSGITLQTHLQLKISVLLGACLVLELFYWVF